MDRVKHFLNTSADLKYQVAETLSGEILEAAQKVKASLQQGGKIFFMGNGGSAADAQHIAAEFIGRYKKERPPLPAIALTVDTSALTAIGNDYGYDRVFERQIQGLVGKNDAVIGISSSGNSQNIVRGLKAANEIGAMTIALLGKTGGPAKDEAKLAIVVPSDDTARIQEVHITIGHIICELLDEEL